MLVASLLPEHPRLTDRRYPGFFLFLHLQFCDFSSISSILEAHPLALLGLIFLSISPEMASWLATRSNALLWRASARVVSPWTSSRPDVRREISAFFNGIGGAGHQCTAPARLLHSQRSFRTIRQRPTSQSRRFSFSSRRCDSDNKREPETGSGHIPSISQRLKDLSRKYGWVAVGVYLALSVIDFPICFFMVRGLGVERIGEMERTVVNTTKRVLGSVWPGSGPSDGSSEKQAEQESHEKALKDNEASKFCLWFYP